MALKILYKDKNRTCLGLLIIMFQLVHIFKELGVVEVALDIHGQLALIT
jgi:hypothetical protein